MKINLMNYQEFETKIKKVAIISSFLYFCFILLLIFALLYNKNFNFLLINYSVLLMFSSVIIYNLLYIIDYIYYEMKNNYIQVYANYKIVNEDKKRLFSILNRRKNDK